MDVKIGEFCRGYNLTLDQFYGREVFFGDLHLTNQLSLPEGFNPKVSGSLYAMNTAFIPRGFNPTVRKNLYLNTLTSIPEGFNPTVGWNLLLERLTSIPDGFNPTVAGNLSLRGLTSIPEGFNPTVGGTLFLDNLTSIPEGFNPTVGGGLFLDRLTSIPEGFSPTVGKNLHLNGLTRIPEGFCPTVGRVLSMRSGLTCWTETPPSMLTWQDGRYVSADGVLTEVVSRRGNVMRVRNIGDDEVFFLVTDGEGNYAHGATLREAREDLLYKVSDRDVSEYEGVSLDHKMTFREAVACYRTITGACAQGVKNFVEQHDVSKRKKYTVGQIIGMTKGAYGGERFEQFFER